MQFMRWVWAQIQYYGFNSPTVVCRILEIKFMDEMHKGVHKFNVFNLVILTKIMMQEVFFF